MNTTTLDGVLSECIDLINSGASLHWLVPHDKMPIEEKWAAIPNQTESSLRSSYRNGANIGIRLGAPSKIDNLYLHLIDLDVRKSELADEAWLALLSLWPEAKSFPRVISGSGGESRHIYFLTDKPFPKKKLAKSRGFTLVYDKKKEREVKKFDWEIDLMGTGSQAVIPPSVHPDTNQLYRWERRLDLDFPLMMALDSAKIEELGVSEVLTTPIEDDDDLENIIRMSPLDIEPEQIESYIADLPEDWVDDRDQWLIVGQAIHHQFGGDNEGFETWCEWARQSEKFDLKDSARVWKSFKGNRNPITFRSIIDAAQTNRLKTSLDLETEDDDHFDLLPAVIPQSSTDMSSLLADDAITTAAPTAQADNNVETDPNWISLLHRNEDGELKSTLPNIRQIVKNDLRISGIMRFNEFTQEIVLRYPPKRIRKKSDRSKPVLNLEGPMWNVPDPLNGNQWTDSHDRGVRLLIEAPTTQGGYGIKVTDRDLYGAVDLAAQERRFHPVRETILQQQWDGIKRVETLFIDYLGCEDNAYHRQASILTLVGAVTRIFEPGHKFDFVPILEGLQGKGKSTFIATLGMNWYSELVGDISDPQEMVGLMQGSWIMEIGELSAMARHEVNDLKAFVSRTFDKARPPYGKRAIVYPRQCIFFGSTNDDEYLRDTTGNRRYWPIVCLIQGMIDNKRLAENVHQVWAEAYQMYFEMRRARPVGDLPLYLTDKTADAEAKMIQESRRVETSEEVLAGEIIAWLNNPIGSEDGFTDLGDKPVYRDETCMLQIWRECLGRSGPIPQNESTKIGKALGMTGWRRSKGQVTDHSLKARYGKTRIYYRD